jgi:cytochrome c-type biogenesis protein CcmH
LITFVAWCLALLLLCAVFVLVPLLRARQEPIERDDNIEWYELRARELERDGQPELDEDARLRLLEDSNQSIANAEAAQPQPRTGNRAILWLLFPCLVLFSAIIYYQLGGMSDVLLAQRLNSIGPETTPGQMDELIEDLQARSDQRPENLYYLSLLARQAMGKSDYTEALTLYERLLESAPEDPHALAYAAQAEYMSTERKLGNQARLRAEMALAADPGQATALGLLGMASYEQGEYRAAISYWERLQAQQGPHSEGSQLIAGVIAQAREALGESGPGSSAENTPSEDSAGAGVTVSISLPEGAATSPSDTLFVLARDANSDSRMPIAVQRLSAAQLPLTLRLDDSNSMAGRKVSEFASVVVAAQISPSGQPGEANASWVATSAPVQPSVSGEPLSLELKPR